jgi:hypothetical protein
MSPSLHYYMTASLAVRKQELGMLKSENSPGAPDSRGPGINESASRPTLPAR